MDAGIIRFRTARVADPRGSRIYGYAGNYVVTIDPEKMKSARALRIQIREQLKYFEGVLVDLIVERMKK